MLRFNFKFQPWRDVLEWFVQQADLSLVMDVPPPGTFNYQDSRSYTPAEAMDLINGVLLTKGYTLVRRERMVTLVNLQDGVPPNLVPTIPLEELDTRGRYELISVVFSLEKLTAEEAEAEVRKLLGPQGSVVILPKAGQIVVTETAGRMRTIRGAIQSVEDPEGQGDKIHTIVLRNTKGEDALAIIRQLLNIPSDKNSTPDGGLRVAVNPSGNMLLVSGKPERVARVQEIVKTIDSPGDGAGGAAQIIVYPISSADPNSVLSVLQTILAGDPDIRLSLDPKTNNLIALARIAQHQTIRATLDEMQRDARQMEVIKLRNVDPLSAVVSINKLFAEGEGVAGGPKIEADTTNRQLLVRGSAAQIAQIRGLLEKMGERDANSVAADDEPRGNVRMIPLTGRAARSAVEQIESIWPTMRKNRIRVVTPSAVVPSLRSESMRLLHPERVASPVDTGPQTAHRGGEHDGDEGEHDGDRRAPWLNRGPLRGDDSGDGPPGFRGFRGPPRREDDDPQTRSTRPRVRAQFAAQNTESPNASTESDGAAGSAQTPRRSGRVNSGQAKQAPDDALPEIIIAPGNGGIMIASEDPEALDDFESLLQTLGSKSFSGTREFTVFYLKYAKAQTVAELLEQIYGGGGGGGGGGSLLSDMAGAAFGDMGGGLMGALLGGGGGGGSRVTTSGSVAIVPDARLNALIVQASSADLDNIEEMLRVLDQKQSPEEISVAARPRMIPVFNTSADSVASVVKTVYSDRLVGANQNRQPSPEDFMRALRGGGGGGRGGRGGGRQQEVEQDKMSVGVDERTNSLIVSASDPLFAEVEILVKQLDTPSNANGETTQVVTLRRSKPQAMGEALKAILGESVKTSKEDSNAGQNDRDRDRDRERGNRGGDQNMGEEMRRRMEFFRNMQQGGGGGGGERGGGGGGGDRGGRGGGFGGRGGGGRGGRGR
jgi:type II secretory pathway component GspD/PulD (secretin)